MHLQIVITIFICLVSIACAVSTKTQRKEPEKRVELEGIYRIQDPNYNSVVAVTEEAKGIPALKVVAMRPLKEGAAGQAWSILTSGPPVARVAAIFNSNDTHNVLSNEFGYVGTSFTRAWQALDDGSGLIVLRNLGLCLTRIEGPLGKVGRSDCNKGKDATAAQKWKLVYMEPLPTRPSEGSIN